jgi:hypothetical protein
VLSTHDETLFQWGRMNAAWDLAVEDLVQNTDCDFKRLQGKSSSLKRIFEGLCAAREKALKDKGSGTGCADEATTEYDMTLDHLMEMKKRCAENALNKKNDKAMPAQVLEMAMKRARQNADEAKLRNKKAPRSSSDGDSSHEQPRIYKNSEEAHAAEMYHIDDRRHPDYQSSE